MEEIKKLTRVCIMFFFFLFFCGNSQALENNLPNDWREYIDNAENCQHFAGEWDIDLSEERKKEIVDGIDQHCTKAKELQKKLKERYKNNIKELKIMEGYEI
ncbi:hypothetical protein ID858_14380 [Xenorhabdus sp. DI]|uniref:hypothetical protein n=1 Tax=Xenorhabdus doucetiae TaxID=351671 RepID=UPI0019AC7BE7|nr:MULTISPECIES: hypothetical protein [unclassified Xenorhabdus]MBD2783638.1 hypothetical protein [Xenorhabdus sp. 3]MBD2789689.1 hypothetical protein [Xenorhabdus sp. DI]